jgi:hypothetical protein
VYIFEAPSLEDILENKTLNLLRRIYISLPPDRDSTALGDYSDDISAFTVYPGFSTRPGRSGWIANKSLSAPDGEGDWVFVTKSISGQGNQTKIYPTHVYSVPAADWRKLADTNIDPYPEIELGVFGADYAPQGELPLPYLLAVNYKTQGISLDDPIISDWLQLIDPKIRAKIRELYNGAGSASDLDENLADILFEDLKPGEMIKDMIDKQEWLNDGGFNPAGSIVVTDITYSEDGRRWFLMTYSGMIEGIVDLTSTLPSLKNFLIEDTMRFSSDHAAMAQFSDGDGNPATLVQMESLSYIPARFFSDDRDALIYSTELEELGMSLQDSTTLAPPVWMARCESELPMGGGRITADSE